jgi:hypothetical protein
LGALTLGRGRQRDHLADARIEPLGNTLDHPALAGGVAALKQHDQFEFLVNDPILQFDQFPLQSQQFAKIGAAVERVSGRRRRDGAQDRIQALIIEFELKLFVDGLEELVIEGFR